MFHRRYPVRAWLWLLTWLPLLAGAVPPVADVHAHYKWSQEEVTSPIAAARILEQHGVRLAVVIGTPAGHALRLADAAPGIVVPIWSPYRSSGDWSTWARDPTVPDRARHALEGGRYRGIGELHFIGGFVPGPRTPVISGLFDLAAKFDVPVLVHTEFGRPDYLLELCRAFPGVRILWAHAGGILQPAQVGKTMQGCPNLWVELSARDPWRFTAHPIAAGDGRLLPAWRALVEAWPHRFMIGSDTVWPVDRIDSWDQADTGWQEYGRFIGFHRGWLRGLDAGVAQKVRFDNAREFFRAR